MPCGDWASRREIVSQLSYPIFRSVSSPFMARSRPGRSLSLGTLCCMNRSCVARSATLEPCRAMAARVCPDTSIRQVIFTDIREYLPLHQRPWLASFIGDSPLAGEPETPYALNPASDTSPPRAGAMAGDAQGTAPSEHAPFRASSFQRLLRRQPSMPLESGTTMDDLALIQYTAGMTGPPKGVMLSHGNLVANVVQRRHWMTDARRGQEVVLSMLPLSHMYGITTGMTMAVALAGALVLVPTAHTDQVLQAVKRYRPT